MSGKKVIAVTGALGVQGGSVVRFLLQDGTFAIRALTRKPDSEKALALKKQGVEVVKADYHDHASLVAAFTGAYGVFGVTNYWEHFNEQQETDEGIAQINAAKEAGVKHVVFSSVADNPDRHVGHWTSKGKINAYLAKSGVPHTTFITTFYFENFIFFGFCQLKKQSDTKYVLDLPLLDTDGPVGAYAVADTGKHVLAVFKDPQTWIGQYFFVPPEIITPRLLVTYLNEELTAAGRSERVEIKETTREGFVKAQELFSVIPGSEEMWGNQENFYESGGKMSYFGPQLPTETGVPASREEIARLEGLAEKAVPQRTTFRAWVKANLDGILAAASKA